MIRRTLKGGLLAAVAVLAILPTAAGAAPANAATARPAATATVRHHHTHHRAHHHRGRVTHRTHHRARHLSLPRAVYGTAALGTPYRTAALATPARRTPALGRVVTRGARLNVRSGPGTGYRVVGYRSAHRLVGLTCRTRGSAVYGNHVWYRLPHHRGYVSAHYVRANRALPWC
ncbi:SH3 domain-containing protein [Streptomyces sp. LP11]|uniref:SH3 domain-containing protein n=1 Tax=Streptomyces pyxinicus TaxID=2970331 RepID=A0ABT2B8P9_9ACTN|nr:SH3 domain-containing protein [Streptomyces sp. LP11]MCS0604790.1 SH3 domain-containing protein [Streptomyces sp. LP11]